MHHGARHLRSLIRASPRPSTLSPALRATHRAQQTSTPLVVLNFVPNTLASLHIPDSNERLVAAGGQDAELHLSIHTRRPHTHSHLRPAPTRSSAHARAHPHAHSPADTDAGTLDPPRARTRRLWQYDNTLSGSINNSVLLTALSLTRSHESSAEPRVAVSNNDCTIKFYDVNVRGSKGVDGPPKRISEAGTLRLDVPVNHCASFPPSHPHHRLVQTRRLHARARSRAGAPRPVAHSPPNARSSSR